MARTFDVSCVIQSDGSEPVSMSYGAGLNELEMVHSVVNAIEAREGDYHHLFPRTLSVTITVNHSE